MRILAMFCLMLALGTPAAMAKSSLRDVREVENGLFAIAVADKIRKECASISGRVLKAMAQLQDLEKIAVSKGYSQAEIDAYVGSPVEKARMKTKRDEYLVKQGVVKSDPNTYCAAGRAEIRKSSRIGELLRAR